MTTRTRRQSAWRTPDERTVENQADGHHPGPGPGRTGGGALCGRRTPAALRHAGQGDRQFGYIGLSGSGGDGKGRAPYPPARACRPAPACGGGEGAGTGNARQGDTLYNAPVRGEWGGCPNCEPRGPEDRSGKGGTDAAEGKRRPDRGRGQ